MSDLISRHAILRKAEPMHDGMRHCSAVNAKYIYTAPAVDAVEVVRCKDCKHWTDATECGLASFPWYRDPHDFCSAGRKKEAIT